MLAQGEKQNQDFPQKVLLLLGL